MSDVRNSRQVSIQTPKKSMLLAQRIVNKIVSEGLTEGDHLAPEAEMCEYYAVGRGTIREALRILENQGVVKIKTGPGGGPVVAAFDARYLAGNFAIQLQLSGATFRDVMDARMAIEPRVAAAAAEKASASAVQSIRATVDRSNEISDDHDLLMAESANFHDLVAAGSENSLLEYLLLALHRLTAPYLKRLDYRGERRDDLIHHHEEILMAIEAGDPQRAAAAMQADLLEFFDYVESEFPQLFDEPVEWARAAP